MFALSRLSCWTFWLLSPNLITVRTIPPKLRYLRISLTHTCMYMYIVYNTLDRRKVCLLSFLDTSSALSCVDQRIILKNLWFLISNVPIKWFSFLARTWPQILGKTSHLYATCLTHMLCSPGLSFRPNLIASLHQWLSISCWKSEPLCSSLRWWHLDLRLFWC